MPANRPLIFLGDLVRALAALQPADTRTRDAILAMLGAQVAPPPTVVVAAPPASAAAQIAPPASPPRQAPPPLSPVATPAASWMGSTLEPVRRLEAAPLPAVPLPTPTGPAPDPAPSPLFRAQWARGIVGVSVATRSDEGAIDLEQLIRLLAQGRPLPGIPRLPWATLRRGAQLLIDRSAALAPYAADQAALEAVIMHTVGQEKTQRLSFAGVPSRGAGTGPQFAWPAYQPPPPLTPVVLLTDLGIGHPPFSNEPASPEEWFAFAQTVRRAGCPLIAVVPYAPRRWPPGLDRGMTIIPWDRTITANWVRHRIGHGHEAPR